MSSRSTRRGVGRSLSKLVNLGTLLALLGSGCASPLFTPIDTQDELRLVDDERRLWAAARAIDAQLERRGLVHEDAILDAYLEDVAARLLGVQPGRGVAPVRVRVLSDPSVNAFAFPNGSIYLNTGLLATLEDEAQLAAVLAHELTHFTHRHHVRQERRLRGRVAVANVLLGATAAMVASGTTVGAAFVDLGSSAAELWVVSSFSGYSRRHEREADAVAFGRVLEAGYELRAGLEMFDHLRSEASEALQDPSEGLATHPDLEARIATWRGSLAAVGNDAAAATDRGAERYASAIAVLLVDNAVLDLAAGHTERARAALERHLAHAPESAPGYYALGELERRSVGMGTTNAQQAYEHAVALDPNHAEAHRALGLIHRASGRPAAARDELATYLRLAPDAADASLIQSLFEEMMEAASDASDRGGMS